MRTPHARLLALAAFAAAACGGDSPSGPAARVPATGRYAFTWTAFTATAAPYQNAGTLTLTSATPDALGGTLTLTQRDAGTVPLTSIGWNVDAYAVRASTAGPLYALRLSRGAGSDLRCSGVHYPTGSATSVPATCTATFIGP